MCYSDHNHDIEMKGNCDYCSDHLLIVNGRDFYERVVLTLTENPRSIYLKS